jgi:hypothetical protein
MSMALTTTGSQLPAGAALRSLLLIECGSVWTQATLLGMVEGHCRLLAHTSAPTTTAEIGTGIRAASRQIERVTGRTLLARGNALSPETETGDGVDGISLIVSAGGPLHLLLVGPGLEVWGTSVRRALATAAVAPLLPPGVAAADYPLLQADMADVPAHQPPQAVLVLGPGPGTLAQPQMRAALEDAAAQALQLTTPTRTLARQVVTLIMGTPETQAALQRQFAGRDAIAIEPPAPGHPGNLPTVLNQIYEQVVLLRIPGFARVRGWGSTAPISSVTALGRFVRFLAQRYAMNVLAVNVGATSTVAIGASVHGNLFTTQAPYLGVRQGSGAIWRRAGYANIARWLEEALGEDTLREGVLARMTQPRQLPLTRPELALDHALAREALRLVMEQGATPGGVGDLPHVDVLLGTGGVLANAPTLGHAALLLLDAVQPRGVTALVVDGAQLASALGAASLLDPMASADAVDMDALVLQLGTCVSVVGAPPPGEVAVRVVLEYGDGHQHVAEVLPGTIECLPLAQGQRARLLLFPAPGVDVGLGPGERAHAGNPVEGGLLGLIVDARGRPLTLPENPQQRQARLRQWMAALGI